MEHLNLQIFSQKRTRLLLSEKQLEELLHNYSSYQNLLKPSNKENQNRLEIENLLSKKEAVIRELKDLLKNEQKDSVTLKSVQVNRHQEIHREQSQLFLRTVKKIKAFREKQSLLCYTKGDPNNSTSSKEKILPILALASESDYYIKEQSAIDSGNNMVESLIYNVHKTKNNLITQNLSLHDSFSKISDYVLSIPRISTLIKQINYRKKRDALIFVVFFSFLLYIFLMF